MVIRNKEGNVYVLEGPNPIVKDQIHWDPKDMVFHNFSWDEINFTQTAKKPKIKPQEINVVIEKPEEPKIEEPTKPEEPKIEEPNKPEEPKIEEPTKPEEPAKEFDLPYIKYRVLCYCLPASTKVHVDKLYGESWQKTTYSKKIIFPCVAMESSDVSFQFWTSDPQKKIGEKSIIYPFSYEVHNVATDSYDRVPYDEYRWWKVSSKESKEGGWLFSCVPSEDHPDFSD